MWDASYRRRLSRDLDAWERANLIAPQSAATIRAGFPAPKSGLPTFGLAGAVLVVAGVFALLSANWHEIDYPTRLAILLGSQIIAHATGAFLVGRSRWAAETALLVAAGLFGASIFALAQMFNLGGEEISRALLLWSLGAFFTAFAGRAQAPLALAIIVLAFWGWFKVPDVSAFSSLSGKMIILAGLIPLAAALAFAAAHRARLVLHLSFLCALSLIASFLSSLANTPFAEGTILFSIYVLLTAGISLAAFRQPAPAQPETRAGFLMDFMPAAARYALLAAIVSFCVLYLYTLDQGPEPLSVGAFLPPFLIAAAVTALALARPLAPESLASRAFFPLFALAALLAPFLPLEENATVFWTYAALVLALALALIQVGQRNVFFIWTGYVFFAFQLAHLYFRAFSSSLDTGLFLLGGGSILIALAAVYHLTTKRDSQGALL